MDREQELNIRRELCRVFISILDKTDDPRKEEALKIYKEQLAEIDQQIFELTGKYPDIVIGLKEAQLFGKVNQ